MSEMNRRRTGAAYEEQAAEYLASRGVQILQRNYRTRTGEIDLVGLDGPYLIFVEVKYRSSDLMGSPLQAVNVRKQRQIIATARQYLYEHRYMPDAPVRFDCIGITPGKTEWIRNAFTA